MLTICLAEAWHNTRRCPLRFLIETSW